MKKCVLFLLTSTLLTVNNRVLAQGSLTPSGPPGPTMITLSQIEPRTIVNAANTPGNSGDSFVISQPGSYYLTTNLIGVSGKNGIEITANNVTLDLNGFAVQGVSETTYGIYIPNAQSNITVRNGAFSGWDYAVYLASPYSVDMVCERLNAANNYIGIVLNSGGVVRDCNASQNDSGISCFYGIVSGCTANDNTSDGIYAYLSTVSGCTVDGNGGDGIDGYNITVNGCSANYNGFLGIVCAGDNTVSGCVVNFNETGGINFENGGGAVSGCTVSENGGPGISSYSGAFISGIMATNNVGFAIQTGSYSVIKDCVASANGGGINVANGAVVSGCMVDNNSGYGIELGIGGVVKDCVASYNSTNGITTGNGCTIAGCSVTFNSGNGVVAASECTINSCTASANNYDGIQADFSCLIKDCTAASNSRYVETGGSGIHVLASGNRIEGNVLNTDEIGIKADGTENVITRNTVRGALSVNYSIVAGNIVGTIVQASTSSAISGSTGGSGMGSTDPWANFSF